MIKLLTHPGTAAAITVVCAGVAIGHFLFGSVAIGVSYQLLAVGGLATTLVLRRLR